MDKLSQQKSVQSFWKVFEEEHKQVTISIYECSFDLHRYLLITNLNTWEIAGNHIFLYIGVTNWPVPSFPNVFDYREASAAGIPSNY